MAYTISQLTLSGAFSIHTIALTTCFCFAYHKLEDVLVVIIISSWICSSHSELQRTTMKVVKVQWEQRLHLMLKIGTYFPTSGTHTVIRSVYEDITPVISLSTLELKDMKK